MAYGWLLSPVVQVVDRNGTPVVGGKVYVYNADLDVLATIYGNDEGTEISNPVLTDTLGNFTIFADSDKVYDIKVVDQNDMLLFTKKHLVVNVGGGGSGSGSIQAGEGINISVVGDVSIISVDYTKVAPLSALDGLASEDWVENQGYLTKTSADTLYQPIGNYALESDLLQVSSDLLSAQSDIDYISANMPVVPELSANEWNSVYETVNTNSGSWSGGGTSLTGDAQGAVDEVYANSGLWNEMSAYQNVSGDFATTAQLSAASGSLKNDIDYVSANIPDVSANEWNSNYETVQANSAQWGQGGQGDVNVNNYVYNNSAKIDDAVSSYQTNSANYLTDSGAFYPMTGNPSGFMDSMFIAVYGQTPYSAVKDAVDNNRIVYCKVSPTGATRMAFLAYGGASNYEFQYYRSVTGHTMTGQGDEVYVYTVANTGWTSAKRNAYTQISAGPGLSGYFTNGANANYKLAVTGYATTGDLNTASSFLSGAVDYVSANVGKIYTGIEPVYVDNTNNEIGVDQLKFSAGYGIDLQVSGGDTLVISSTLTGDLGHTYTGISPIVVDNDANTISLTGSVGHTYTGIAPITVNNNNDTISISGKDLVGGYGIDIQPVGNYYLASSNLFPMADNGFSANVKPSAITLLSQYSNVNFTNSSVSYAQAPSINASATWYDIINMARNSNSGITVSSYTFKFSEPHVNIQLSAVSSLEQITFIAPWGGPTDPYSASFMNGDITAYTLEVWSGCCRDIVKSRDYNSPEPRWYLKKWEENYGFFGQEAF